MKLFLRRVLSIAAKEAKHIRRDPFTLAVSLVSSPSFAAMTIEGVSCVVPP